MATRVNTVIGRQALTHGLRTALETVIFCGAAILLLTYASPSLAPGMLETALFPLFAVAIPYYFTRLQLVHGKLSTQSAFELLYSVLLGSFSIGVLFVFAVWRIPNELLILDWEGFSSRFMLNAATYFTDANSAERTAAIRNFEFSLVDALAQFVAFFTVISMFTIRLGKRLWIRWKALRNRHLIWEMTHAHLVLVVAALALLLFFLSVYVINQTLAVLASDELSGIIIVVAALIFTYVSGAVVGVVALLALLAPAALLSYWMSRPIVERLATLTHITAELNQGNYAIRLNISGQDELSHLQTNFNSMAATLQETLIALQAEHDMLHHLLNSRRALFTNISHELRTPIATMRVYLESLQERAASLPAELVHDLDIMYRETLHLQRLIDDFLLLTRAEEVGLALNPVPTDIHPILERLAETMAPAARKNNQVDVIAAVHEQLPFALVDELRLEQIIHNLLQNAIRHTPPGGQVTLSARSSGPDVVIQVQDTGSGISPDDLPHIWQRFYRSEQAREHHQRGAGLGLALVKELVEAMRGRVAVESTPGQGSHFMVWLPQATPTHSPAPLLNLEGARR